MPIVHCDVRSVEDRVAVHSFDCISATTPRLLLQQAISRPRSRRQTASRPSRSANPSAGTIGLTVVHCNLRSASSLNARTSGILVFIAAIQIDFAAPSKAYSFGDASRISSPQNYNEFLHKLRRRALLAGWVAATFRVHHPCRDQLLHSYRIHGRRNSRAKQQKLHTSEFARRVRPLQANNCQ